MERAVGGVLALVAALCNKAGALMAPKRQLQVYPHRNFATSPGRTWGHFDAYRSGPGEASLEFGGWSVDVSWRSREESAARA